MWGTTVNGKWYLLKSQRTKRKSMHMFSSIQIGKRKYSKEHSHTFQKILLINGFWKEKFQNTHLLMKFLLRKTNYL